MLTLPLCFSFCQRKRETSYLLRLGLIYTRARGRAQAPEAPAGEGPVQEGAPHRLEQRKANPKADSI